MSGRDASLTAISRSLDVYYRDHARTARMDQLAAAVTGLAGLGYLLCQRKQLLYMKDPSL